MVSLLPTTRKLKGDLALPLVNLSLGLLHRECGMAGFFGDHIGIIQILGGPNTEDDSILVSTLGCPYFGKLPYRAALRIPSCIPC